MAIGFTGTQQGLTSAQRNTLFRRLEQFRAEGENTIDLGDCVGGDYECYVVASGLGYHTIGHPPIKTGKRAFCAYDKEWEPKDYHERDHDIVDHGNRALIAAPKLFHEERFSGTWVTVRYARKVHRRIILIWPDGTETEE